MIQLRNTALDKMLIEKLRYPMDVDRKGNCFYRAILFFFYNQQSSHSHLRHLSNNYALIFYFENNSLCDGQKSIKKCIKGLESDGN